MKTFKEHRTILAEKAGMARLIKHMQDSDCVIITAFRRYNSEGRILTRPENRQRNRDLLVELRGLGYGPIWLKGTYEEEELDSDDKGTGNFILVIEESWFVPELFGDESALMDMLNLGKIFDQDSVLYTHHPIEREDEEIIEASIIGTSDERAIAQEQIPIGELSMEKIGNLYSQIGKRKFAFVAGGNENAQEVEEAHKRLLRPDGLTNAYAKREFFKNNS